MAYEGTEVEVEVEVEVETKAGRSERVSLQRQHSKGPCQYHDNVSRLKR
jgi:hypothetical protein